MFEDSLRIVSSSVSERVLPSSDAILFEYASSVRFAFELLESTEVPGGSCKGSMAVVDVTL